MKSTILSSKSLLKSITFICLNVSLLFSGCKSDDLDTIQFLPSNTIRKITIDKLGVKWIATDKGLVSFNGKTWKIYPGISSFSDFPIFDVAFDDVSDKTQLWVGTGLGAHKASISGQSLTLNTSHRLTNNGLLSDTVWSVASDHNGATFFGTPGGLSILKNTGWTSYDGKWGNKSTDKFLTVNEITAIASAKNGWNYVSTSGGGVSRFQFTDAVSGATKYFQPWAYGLKSDTVFTVIIVNDSCQWYGTTKGAAYHSSHNTKADWTSYAVADGLASDTVYAIAQDLSGNTWFGTQGGASKLENNVWTSYTIRDGLISNKVNTLAIDIDGSLWFGTDAGISHLKDGVWKSYVKK